MLLNVTAFHQALLEATGPYGTLLNVIINIAVPGHDRVLVDDTE